MTEPTRNFKLTLPWCRNSSVFATLRRSSLAASAAVAMVILSTLGVGCDTEKELGPASVASQGGPTLAPDVSFTDADTGAEDRPLRSFCPPRERRCIFENSPIFEECAPDGQTFEVGSCDAAQMCRQGRCVDFSCAPGQSICVGTQTRATCAEDGRSFRDLSQCEGSGDVCRGGECIDACEAAAREQSYIGCEYLARELPNLYRRGGEADKDAPFAVVVANPNRLLDTQVTITTPNGEPAKLLESVQVSRGTAVVRSEVLSRDATTQITSPATGVSVPPRAAAVFLLDPGEPAVMRAYRVESTRPIIAYQFSPYCCNYTYTNDASLLLPTTTLAKRYRVLSYPSMIDELTESYAPATFTVVAHRDDTVVDITSPIDLLHSSDDFPQTPFEGGPVELQAGESITFGTATIFLGQTTQNRDLSGTEVEANEKVAVYAGHACTFVPQDEWACDHLEEQMFPAESLGERYLLTPTRRRGAKSRTREQIYWRILADADSTISFSPPLDELDAVAPSNDVTPDCREKLSGGQLILEAGEICEFGVLSPVALESSGALIVGGVISGHESTGLLRAGTRAGDPSFFLAPPVEQYRQNYSFVSPPTFAGNYVAVAVPRGGAVALDGIAIPDAARLELRQVELGDKTWDVYNVAIEAGYHTMASEQRFGIVVYAYDDFVSYAFPGGLDLLPKGSR